MATHVEDRNTVAHCALERLLSLVGEHIDTFQVQIKINSTVGKAGHVNTLSSEIANDDGTWCVESNVDSTTIHSPGAIHVSQYRHDIKFESSVNFNACDPDYHWAAAKAGWQMILNWVNEQRAIDGDDVQAYEILNEWINESIKKPKTVYDYRDEIVKRVAMRGDLNWSLTHRIGEWLINVAFEEMPAWELAKKAEIEIMAMFAKYEEYQAADAVWRLQHGDDAMK